MMKDCLSAYKQSNVIKILYHLYMRMGQLQTAKAVLRVGGQLSSKVINHDERLFVGLQTVECNKLFWQVNVVLAGNKS